jgi:predicted signal transduction protein with EAL and GGDEF domain
MLRPVRGLTGARRRHRAGVGQLGAPASGRSEPLRRLANAEIACKAAKDRGRNRVEIFQDADQSIMRRSTDIIVVQALHEALAADRFALFVQPILPLNAGHTEPRFEFLLRMVSENSELLPPEKFLSAAERYQLLPAIDRWVIKNAIGRSPPRQPAARACAGSRSTSPAPRWPRRSSSSSSSGTISDSPAAGDALLS